MFSISLILQFIILILIIKNLKDKGINTEVVRKDVVNELSKMDKTMNTYIDFYSSCLRDADYHIEKKEKEVEYYKEMYKKSLDRISELENKE